MRKPGGGGGKGLHKGSWGRDEQETPWQDDGALGSLQGLLKGSWGR